MTERYRPSIAEYCRKPSDNPPSAWTAEGVERMKKLKEAQMEGKFEEAFDEMFPETASKLQGSPKGGPSKQYDNPIEQVMFILGRSTIHNLKRLFTPLFMAQIRESPTPPIS